MTLVSVDVVDLRVTEELLRVASGVAGLCVRYYSVAVLTNSVYRAGSSWRS